MYKNNAYATHQPFLATVLKHTTGPVLECGCGDGSTVFMRQQLDPNRLLVSLESNTGWLAKYIHMASEYHRLLHVPASNDDTPATGQVWVDFIKRQTELPDFEVVFLDSSPWSSRLACFDYFKSRARVIVIHDFDYYPGNGLLGRFDAQGNCDLSGVIRHSRLFYPDLKFKGPPTLICSEVMSVEEFQGLLGFIEAEVPAYYA